MRSFVRRRATWPIGPLRTTTFGTTTIGTTALRAAAAAASMLGHFVGECHQFVTAERAIVIGIVLHRVVDEPSRILHAATRSARSARSTGSTGSRSLFAVAGSASFPARVTGAPHGLGTSARLVTAWRTVQFIVGDRPVTVLIQFCDRLRRHFDFLGIDDSIAVDVEGFEHGTRWRSMLRRSTRATRASATTRATMTSRATATFGTTATRRLGLDRCDADQDQSGQHGRGCQCECSFLHRRLFPRMGNHRRRVLSGRVEMKIPHRT